MKFTRTITITKVERKLAWMSVASRAAPKPGDDAPERKSTDEPDLPLAENQKENTNNE